MLRWKEFYGAISKKYNIDRSKFEQTYNKYDHLSLRGEITAQQLWEKVAKDIGLEYAINHDYSKLAMEAFSPIPETHDFVRELEPHLPFGILSNISSGYFELSMRYGYIPKLKYQAVIESWKIGLIKPQKEIYMHAQKMANVPHENILFIDDMEENTKAAERLGWQTVIFDTDNPRKSVKMIKSKLKQY